MPTSWATIPPSRPGSRTITLDSGVYIYRGVVRKYRPDFIVRLTSGEYLVLETKGRHGYPGPDCRVQDDIRRERQMDGIAKAKNRGVRFGRKPELTPERIAQIKKFRKAGTTVPDIMRQTKLSKASVYRALGR